MIRISDPQLAGNELRYLTDCVRRRQFSAGPFVAKFERRFAEYLGVRDAVACMNGTVALHLALTAAGIFTDDEVIVPVLTYVATANAVTYCGARPVFVDVDPVTWCLDATKIRAAMTKATRLILPVQLYGYWPDMRALQEIGLPLIEDAAEGLGATYAGHYAGTLGQMGVFSFYGNKTITCGEGGMIVTNNPELADTCRRFRGQGVRLDLGRYYHDVIGFNYRMTELQAAVGLAQLEGIQKTLDRRQQILALYRDRLSTFDMPRLRPRCRASAWMMAVCVPVGISRPAVQTRLDGMGIETRPVFTPLHHLPMYRQDWHAFPVANTIATRGLCLPTHTGLSDQDVQHICSTFQLAVADEHEEQT